MELLKNKLLAFSIKIFYLADSSLQDSILVTGTKKLIEDATKGLAIVAGVATVLVALFFLVRALMSENERPRHFKSMGMTLGIGVLITLVSALTSLILGYYN